LKSPYQGKETTDFINLIGLAPSPDKERVGGSFFLGLRGSFI